MSKFDYSIADISDSLISFCFSDEIDEKANSKIHRLIPFLENNDSLGIISCYSSYTSLLVNYDFLKISRDEVIHLIIQIMDDLQESNDVEDILVEIPVLYGGEFGRDLVELSQIVNLEPDEVIKIHSEVKYHVYMIGFSPGFPYLGGLDDRLKCPRLESPRQNVPSGSVGIANNQTGIYPHESPGGWRIIGRTPLKLFDINNKELSVIKPGSKVTFNPISKKEFFRFENGSF